MPDMTVSPDQDLVFELTGLTLLCPLNQIQEVLSPETVSPMFGSQPWFLGMAVHHGRLVPVSDLGDFLCEQPSRDRPTHKWLVVQATDEVFAVVVDNVLGVADAVASRYESPTDDALGQALPAALADVAAESIQLEGQQAYRVSLAGLLSDRAFADIRTSA